MLLVVSRQTPIDQNEMIWVEKASSMLRKSPKQVNLVNASIDKFLMTKLSYHHKEHFFSIEPGIDIP